MRQTLNDILELGSLIYHDEDLGLYFVWNGHLTFNAFWQAQDKFQCADCFIVSDQPASIDLAIRACKDYVNRVLEEMNEEETV